MGNSFNVVMPFRARKGRGVVVEMGFRILAGKWIISLNIKRGCPKSSGQPLFCLAVFGRRGGNGRRAECLNTIPYLV